MKSMMGAVLLAGLVLLGAAPRATGNTNVRTAVVASPEASERWNGSLEVPRFDPRLGTLRSVTLRLTMHVVGTTRFENLNPTPLTLTQTVCALFELRRPNFSTLLQELPLARTTESVGPYDGTTDFGGTSGRTRTQVVATGLAELTVNNPNDLLLFTGSGSVRLPVLARPKPTSVGAGNYAHAFATRSRVELTVTYSYEAAPVAVEPVSWSAIKSLYR